MAGDDFVRIRAPRGLAVAAHLRARGPRAMERAGELTAHYGALLLTEVKANASTGYHAPGEGHIPGTGPGPNVATGDYRRGIGLEVSMGAGVAVAIVGSNHAQARRLELGFSGTDSRGRSYNQPPYPHFAPALDVIGPAYAAAIRALGTEAA